MGEDRRQIEMATPGRRTRLPMHITLHLGLILVNVVWIAVALLLPRGPKDRELWRSVDGSYCGFVSPCSLLAGIVIALDARVRTQLSQKTAEPSASSSVPEGGRMVNL